MRTRLFLLRVVPLFLVSLAVVSIIGCGSSGTSMVQNTPPPPTTNGTIALTPVVSGLSNPVDLETPDDGTGRLFVLEQAGRIRIISGGALMTTPFLDITASVNFDGSEQGLLGVAFHPNFAANPRFYLNYDRMLAGGQLQTVIAEFQVAAGTPNVADPASERILITQNQPFPNHKAGQMVFGADGSLYFGLGDGGSGGDPLGNGQNVQTLLGKMLRIDVDHITAPKQYAIPVDNPFASGGGLPEIFAYGFRNPWRFSLDHPSGRFFVADVGQDRFEEIDILQKGGNFGWNTMEGLHCFNPATGCNMAGLVLPIFEYDHTQGIAVIGGYVYHGTAIPQLQGQYLFSDFGSGMLWSLTEGPPNTWTRTAILSTGRNISSFGQDAAGEIYMLDLAGSVLKLVSQ